MNKKEVTFRDPVVERVVDKFVSRSYEGFRKYGATLDDERRSGVKDLDKYLNDVRPHLVKKFNLKNINLSYINLCNAR